MLSPCRQVWALALLLCIASVTALNVKTRGSGPTGGFVPRMVSEDGSLSDEGRQRWGYVEVRPGAFLFWWLYYTTHSDGYLQRPWVIWLEGGPGDAASVVANLGAIGPKDAEGTPRSTSWVNSVSVMFIDSPVGVGFSYFNQGATMPNTTEDTTDDLIELYKVFTNSYTEFKDLPLYIFGHSYGGRATSALGYFMQKAKQRGELSSNLKGIGMGNAWVSPFDSTRAIPPLFLNMGFIGKEKYTEMAATAEDLIVRMKKNVATGVEDSELVVEYFDLVMGVPNIYQYNMFRFGPEPPDQTNLINTVIKEQLRIIPENVNISSDGCCDGLFRYDVFREVYGWTDKVLKMGDVRVVIYQGNLDIVCPTKGAMDWVDRFTWKGMKEFRKQSFEPVDAPKTPPTTDMYVRTHGQLAFYTVINSGHYVTSDAPEVALHLLNRVVDETDVKQA